MGLTLKHKFIEHSMTHKRKDDHNEQHIQAVVYKGCQDVHLEEQCIRNHCRVAKFYVTTS